jgi:hypothetical protein
MFKTRAPCTVGSSSFGFSTHPGVLQMVGCDVGDVGAAVGAGVVAGDVSSQNAHCPSIGAIAGRHSSVASSQHSPPHSAVVQASLSSLVSCGNLQK